MDITRDDILYGELVLKQPVDGPRVNVDTVLLAAYCRVRRGERVLELGAAHGAVALLLAKRYPHASSIEGLEVQKDLWELSKQNAEENGLSDKVTFRQGDLREVRRLYKSQSFDVVVVNPPYDEIDRSRPSPNFREATARHGVACTFEDVAAAVKFLLRNKGRLYLVMRAKRLAEVCSKLTQKGLQPRRLRLVHPKPESDASVFLMEATRSDGIGMLVEPPLFIHGSDGSYTEELLRAYRIGDNLCR
jgi:tRNA1(Val) A37 N6-methylase TrmN6